MVKAKLVTAVGGARVIDDAELWRVEDPPASAAQTNSELAVLWEQAFVETLALEEQVSRYNDKRPREPVDLDFAIFLPVAAEENLAAAVLRKKSVEPKILEQAKAYAHRSLRRVLPVTVGEA